MRVLRNNGHDELRRAAVMRVHQIGMVSRVRADHQARLERERPTTADR